MAMEGDQAQGDEYTIELTDITLQSCTPEIYRMLLANVNRFNKK